MEFAFKNALTLSLVVLITACGGGGGGGGGSYNPSTAPVAITASNYVGVATDSVAGAIGTSNASSSVTSLVGAQISQPMSFSLRKVALSTTSIMLDNWAVFNKPTIVGAVTESTFNCSGGGTASGFMNDADNSNSPTTGDSISATFTGCIEDGLLMNGSFSIDIKSFNGDLSTSGAAALTIAFNNFTADGAAINGSIILAMSTSGATTSSLTLTMPNISVTSSENYLAYSNFNMTASINGSLFSLRMAGNASSSNYGGSVEISTPSEMIINSSNNSASGTILMLGKNRTSVRLVGQGLSGIRIEADTSGNGTYDINSTVTLANLGL